MIILRFEKQSSIGLVITAYGVVDFFVQVGDTVACILTVYPGMDRRCTVQVQRFDVDFFHFERMVAGVDDDQLFAYCRQDEVAKYSMIVIMINR